MRNTAEKVCKFIWLRAIFSSLARLIVPKLWNSLKPLRTWCRAPPSSIRRGVWRFRELYAESEVGVNHGRETAKRDSLNWKTLENKDTTLIVCPILFNTTFNQTCRATLKHLSSLPFPFLFYSIPRSIDWTFARDLQPRFVWFGDAIEDAMVAAVGWWIRTRRILFLINLRLAISSRLIVASLSKILIMLLRMLL